MFLVDPREAKGRGVETRKIDAMLNHNTCEVFFDNLEVPAENLMFGGFGCAREYGIERKWRETRLYQTAPISTNMILAYVGQHVLGKPRSY